MTPLQTELNKFRPAVSLEDSLGRVNLTRFRFIFLFIFLVSLVCLYINIELNNGQYAPALLGTTLIFFALWLEQILLFCYQNNYYFKGFDSIIGSAGKGTSGLSYEAARLILSNEKDLTGAFMTSMIGREIIIRSGLNTQDIENFLLSNRKFLPANVFPLQTNRLTTVPDIALYIYMYDADFKIFLDTKTIDGETFFGAINFAHKIHLSNKAHARWWSRDNLSLHTGIGRELSTAHNGELGKFTHILSANSDVELLSRPTPTKLKLIQKIEETLARNRSANILLLGEKGVDIPQLLADMAARSIRGQGLNSVTHIKFIELETTHLLQTYTTKEALENELGVLFSQAGTEPCIMVIEELSDFIIACENLNVDLTEILSEYLTQSNIHIIGLDTPQQYHRHLKSRHSFIKRFEEIIIEESNDADTIAILETVAIRQEKRRGVFFTYKAIVAVAELAKRYLSGEAMPERAIDLLHDVAHKTQNTGDVTITEELIQNIVSEKTGIPIGPVSVGERDRLLNLETILHNRVVGQETAIKAVAQTMRRARVDIERADKPIGSFLFLGPTGVGKTETAKALAETFFGNEENMIRLDMTEFKGSHTLGHLIGDENGTGILTDKLHERPYCVLLLDEFEKADSSVHDLFLQILDEGYFTSNQGKKVNTRNTIIIATSNAGSDLINKTAKLRAETPVLDGDIINHIIEKGIFKPELINRFDNTIIFEPLTKDAMRLVTELQITALITRVRDRGYHLNISSDLIEALTEKVFSPHASGRDIGRVIQDNLESLIATKILSGVVLQGGFINLTREDIS